MASVELSMYRGDTALFPFAVTDSAGAYNIAGASFWFTAKKTPCDADVSAVFQKTLADGITVTNAAAGLGQVELAEADTNTLPCSRTILTYDLQMKTAAGKVYTLAYGKLTVNPDVTVTTT